MRDELGGSRVEREGIQEPMNSRDRSLYPLRRAVVAQVWGVDEEVFEISWEQLEEGHQ